LLPRSDAGEFFGVYARTRKPRSQPAARELKLTVDNPFRGVDFFETAESGLLVRR
jgi:hypothetical protein